LKDEITADRQTFMLLRGRFSWHHRHLAGITADDDDLLYASAKTINQLNRLIQ